MLSRRDLFKRLAAAGLVAATVPVGDWIQSGRRYWRLDRTHLWHPDEMDIRMHYEVLPEFGWYPGFKDEIVGVNARNNVVRFTNQADPTSAIDRIESLDWFYTVHSRRINDPIHTAIGREAIAGVIAREFQ